MVRDNSDFPAGFEARQHGIVFHVRQVREAAALPVGVARHEESLVPVGSAKDACADEDAPFDQSRGQPTGIDAKIERARSDARSSERLLNEAGES